MVYSRLRLSSIFLRDIRHQSLQLEIRSDKIEHSNNKKGQSLLVALNH